MPNIHHDTNKVYQQKNKIRESQSHIKRFTWKNHGRQGNKKNITMQKIVTAAQFQYYFSYPNPKLQPNPSSYLSLHPSSQLSPGPTINLNFHIISFFFRSDEAVVDGYQKDISNIIYLANATSQWTSIASKQGSFPQRNGIYITVSS